MGAPTVVIEEVLGRAEQGVTEPFICQGDDGEVYYVKGIGAGRRSQVCEWVAAQLASAFGLPIAEYTLAELPPELVALKAFPGIAELGAGIVFASRRLPHVQELTLTTRGLVPAELATDLLIFDWWVRNEDRHLSERGCNPNLLWDVEAAELAVIDHHQAFDRAFNAPRFLESHMFVERWNRVSGDHVERARYMDRLAAALAAAGDIRASIPESWWWFDEGVPADVSWDEIAHCLDRCRDDAFWKIE